MAARKRHPLQRDPRASRDLAAIIEGERQYARLGAVARGGTCFVPHGLRAARRLWAATQQAGGPAADLLARKVAYALGGIAHYPTDFLMKPLMSRLAGGDWNKAHEQMQAGTASAEAVGVRCMRQVSQFWQLRSDELPDISQGQRRRLHAGSAFAYHACR